MFARRPLVTIRPQSRASSQQVAQMQMTTVQFQSCLIHGAGQRSVVARQGGEQYDLRFQEEEEAEDVLLPEEREKMDEIKTQVAERAREYEIAIEKEMEKDRRARRKQVIFHDHEYRKFKPEPKEEVTVKGLSFQEGLDYAMQTREAFNEDRRDRMMHAIVDTFLDPQKAPQRMRGVITLPHGTGQQYTICVVCDEDKAQEAKDAGADYVGEDDMITRIKEGLTAFDKLICTKKMMPKVAALGRQLGPLGLMPSPKTGTVTDDIGAAVSDYKGGKYEFNLQNNATVDFPIGNYSLNKKQILENFIQVLRALDSARPEGFKAFEDVVAGLNFQVDDGEPIPVQSTELRPLALKYELELSVDDEEDTTDEFADVEQYLKYMETLTPEHNAYVTYEGVQVVNYPQWMYDEGHLEGVRVARRRPVDKRPKRKHMSKLVW